MGLGKNLSELLDKKNTNPNELALNIGVSAQTIYSMIKRDSKKADIEVLIKIASALNVSVDELLDYDFTTPTKQNYLSTLQEKYNKLEPLWQQAVDGLIETGLKQNLVLEPVLPSTVYPFPYCSNMSASAGTGMPVLDMANFETVELKKAPPKGSTFLVRVAGNSMEPTYHDGDVVFIKRQDIIRIGEVGLWMVDGLAYIKERGDNCLISHNEDYSPIEIDEYTQVMCYGKVTGVCDEL